MTTGRGARAALWLLAGVVLAFIYVPLVVVTVNSFNADKTFAWPPTGWTLQWWSAAAESPGPREALGMSVGPVWAPRRSRSSSAPCSRWR